MSIRIPLPLRAELETHSREGYPHEVCGLLVGRRRDGAAEVERVVPARNLDRERARDRYELDPADYLAADGAARAAGLDVVGIWHTHPDHPARPSETDRARAWEGWSYVILSVLGGSVAELRSWRLSDGELLEEPLESEPRT